MFIRSAALALSLIAFSSHLMAEDLPLGCYVNSYDKAHLVKHKSQRITSIKMLIEDARKLENSQAAFHAEFDVTLRGEGKTKWGDVGLCNGKSGNWKCGIECDGGGFELAEDANGLTVINTRGFRVTKDGGCGEVTDYIAAEPGNRMFRLSKAKLSACK